MKLKKLFESFTSNHVQRLLLLVLFLELLVFAISGISFSFLEGATFYDFHVDVFFWVVYLLKLPQYITSHFWMGMLLDVATLILLLILILKPNNTTIAALLFVLLFLFYLTLMGYLAHRNYHVGFFLVLVPFLFKSEYSRAMAFEATRYYLLFFYVSAAILKLWYGALGNINHFSNQVIQQFKPYFLEGNTGMRTDFNLYLVNHPQLAQSLFLLSFIAELVVFIGFITKRFDTYLGIILLLFHFSNWFVMDIAAIGQIAFICLLFVSSGFKTKLLTQSSLKRTFH